MNDVPQFFRLNVEVGNLEQAINFYSTLLGVQGRKQPGARSYFECGPVTLSVIDVSSVGSPHTAGNPPGEARTVDDNEHMRNLLRAMLFAFGFKSVQSEEDGRAALSAMHILKPDIVVTDYSMHPVDGIEFVKGVRALNSPMAWTPVIMVTGHKERHYVERARDAGVTELLSKPVTARDLFLRIKEVIERPRPFIKAPSFLGPDRRRRKMPQALLNKRRSSDREIELVNS